VRIAAERADRIAIVGGSERAGSEAIGRALAPGAVISDGVAKAAATADVWIDFTTPEATLAALVQLANTNVKAAIVGTTGLAPIHDQKIAAHAKRIAIVKSGNYSLCVNLLLGLIEQTSKRLGAVQDDEISEMHHRRKVDAPSGTDLMM